MTYIKPLERIARKYETVTPGRQAEYEEGVKNPKADWMDQTLRAEAAYEAGLRASLSAKTFGKGVKNRGTAFWQKKTLAKGPGRWAEGVAMSGDDYIEGFAPYAEVISRTVLPERGPVGDPKNIQRVAIIAKALHDAKLKLKG